MSSYYYLVAQLPTLNYAQAAPMSSSVFLELCRQQLDKDDMLHLEAGRGGEFWDKYYAWNEALKLNLAKFRAQKLGRPEAAAMEAPASPEEAVNAAKTAVGFDSPLDAEQFLDQARWNAVESLQGLDYFNVNTVFGYLLKLKLMERKALFNAETGFGEYKKLYDEIIGERT
jgi:hypothetical protein